MLYGVIKRLLTGEYADFDDTVLIESPFRETNQTGALLRFVQLGLTGKAFIIASEYKYKQAPSNRILAVYSSVTEIISFYPWESLKLSVVKRCDKQYIKASFSNNTVRYFELWDMPKKQIFWKLWCYYIKELNSSTKTWPFSLNDYDNNKQKYGGTECTEYHVKKCFKKAKKYPRKWTDKYIYLGSQRETQDKVRPVPISGLGNPEEIKTLLYLKPKYFGCWEQSEHWVQCRESSKTFCEHD